MTKPNDDATLKSGTHFEQVPLEEVVKKIANLTVEPASEKTEPYSMPAGSVRLSDPVSSPNEGARRRGPA